MNAVTQGRPLLSMAVARTLTAYTLTVEVPEWGTGAQREYQYTYATMAALLQAMDRIRDTWLDAELIALGDSLTPC